MSGHHTDWKDTNKGEWKIPSVVQAKINNHGSHKIGGQQDSKKGNKEKNGATKSSVNGLLDPKMVEKFLNFPREIEDPTISQIAKNFANCLSYTRKELICALILMLYISNPS